jgi:aldose 1-epimerase
VTLPAVQLITHELLNAHGDRVRLLNCGARITALELALPGGMRNVVLGYPDAQHYLDDPYYMGCTTGRYANRIAGARFEIGGQEFRLAANEGAHQLHGGPQGLHRRFWRIAPGASARHVRFSLVSEDGDQGYPGRLEIEVTYEWNDRRELSIEYAARSDRPTHVNPGNHAYFNLEAGSEQILDHHVRVNGTRVVAVDAECIPTGELLDVRGGDLDLRRACRVGDVVASRCDLIRGARGLDLNYVLDDGSDAAQLWSGSGDLALSVSTTYPGLQCYSGQHLRQPWREYGGLCLEPQFFPDSPNRPQFPSTLLLPGSDYRARITYGFRALRAGASGAP